MVRRLGVRSSAVGAQPRAAFRALAFVWVLAALFGTACSGGESAKPLPTPEAGDLLKAAADRMAAVKTFHFVLDHENGGTPIIQNLSMRRAEGDMGVPDRLRADVSAVAPSFGNLRVDVQVIAVGDNAQITNPFNRAQWVPLPGKTPLSAIFDPAAGAVALLRSVTDARITGSEKINGVDTWKVEGPLKATDLVAFMPTAEAGYTLKGTAWIGQSDKQLYRVRLEGAAGADDAPNVIRKLDFSKYDQPVKIELP